MGFTTKRALKKKHSEVSIIRYEITKNMLKVEL